MRALVQRVSQASVSVNRKITGQIDKGLLIFIGVSGNDDESDAKYLAEKCANVRIFEDSNEKMNLSIQDISGSALVVSQFTLYADTRRGNRPSFSEAASLEKGERLYELFVQQMRALLGPKKVATGVFRAMMDVALVNDGPVTIMLQSKPKNGN